MKKKCLTMMAMVFFVAVTMNLQAQDSPNGGTTPGGGNAVNDPLTWNRTGNSQESGTVYNMLGFTNGTPIRFCTNNLNRMYIDANGKIGINTTNPLQRLHVLDGNILISRSVSDELGSTNGSIYFGDVVDASEPYGKWGIEYVSSAEEGYGLNFWKPWFVGQGGGNHYLFLADNGNVGVVTNDPPAKFSVNGKILAREVHVCTDPICWADYVFDEEYHLMSLNDLAEFVAANKHLPGVPSAKEVDEQGSVDLGEMNVILLEKVEELTRYVIDLQKQIEELRQQKQ